MKKIRSIKEIKERHDNLKTNFNLLKNENGKERVSVEIKTLERYLINPKINLEMEIENSFGEQRGCFLWIAGYLT